MSARFRIFRRLIALQLIAFMQMLCFPAFGAIHFHSFYISGNVGGSNSEFFYDKNRESFVGFSQSDDLVLEKDFKIRLNVPRFSLVSQCFNWLDSETGNVIARSGLNIEFIYRDQEPSHTKKIKSVQVSDLFIYNTCRRLGGQQVEKDHGYSEETDEIEINTADYKSFFSIGDLIGLNISLGVDSLEFDARSNSVNSSVKVLMYYELPTSKVLPDFKIKEFRVTQGVFGTESNLVQGRETAILGKAELVSGEYADDVLIGASFGDTLLPTYDGKPVTVNFSDGEIKEFIYKFSVPQESNANTLSNSLRLDINPKKKIAETNTDNNLSSATTLVFHKTANITIPFLMLDDCSSSSCYGPLEGRPSF